MAGEIYTRDGKTLEVPLSRMFTPQGEIIGYVRESYVGLRGQERICIVGPMGRQSHFDADEVTWPDLPAFAPNVIESRVVR